MSLKQLQDVDLSKCYPRIAAKIEEEKRNVKNSTKNIHLCLRWNIAGHCQNPPRKKRK